MKHTFAVLAYGESPYLEACLRSLKQQTAGSEVLICTSTPGEYLDRLSLKYGFPLRVRNGEPGIGRDWNFAMSEASGKYVTLAHQDDIYLRDYAETVLEAAKAHPDMALFTSASVTLKNGELKEWGLEETVKKLLRTPLRFTPLTAFPAVKRAVFLFGNPVICPSVTYRKDICGEKPFSEDLKFVLDWELLSRLAGEKGVWVCSERPKMIYRVHGDAATAACIRDHVREAEEDMMFRRMWPEPAAALIQKFYRRSYEAYDE